MNEDQEAVRKLAYELWEKSPLPKLDAEHYWYLAEAMMTPVEKNADVSAWQPAEPLQAGSPEEQKEPVNG